MPKLLIFDAFTLLIREKNVAIYALLRCKMSQFTHFCGVKFLASKSGTWEFWTNFMSGNSSAESFSEKARKPLIALASLHHIVIKTFFFSVTGTLRFKAFLSLLMTV